MRLELRRGILGSQGRDNTTCQGEEGQVSSRRVWYGMVWYGMVWYGTVWYGKSIVWHGMGWYEYGMVWKASGWMRVGGISGRQARATVGVDVCGACPVCACVPGRGGGAYTVSQDWSQSLPRNMRGPGEGRGRGREIPPSLVTLGTRAAHGSSLSCTGSLHRRKTPQGREG